MQHPDFVREPYLGWCEVCHQWVIALNGHCFNDDAHRTSVFTPEERRELYSGRTDVFEY